MNEESNFITTKVTKVIEENYRVKTIELGRKIDAIPGQFIMVWVPKLGEKPFSIACADPLTLTIANVGPVSKALHELKPGDLCSFRGPFGNGFKIQEKTNEILLVGGGYGVVPLYFLALEAKKRKIKTTVILGAKNEKDIIFEKRFNECGAKVLVSTDDGSRGFKGNAVECAKEELKKMKDVSVYTCGPEKMMYFLALYCKEANIPCQVSLERYMKCGVGLCGSCALDKVFVCRDGPIFEGEVALGFKEFGEVIRNSSGKVKKL